MFTPDRELNPPDSHWEDKKELPNCACCLEEVEQVFVLGIQTYGLKEKDEVCSYCLNELHNNLTLTN